LRDFIFQASCLFRSYFMSTYFIFIFLFSVISSGNFISMTLKKSQVPPLLTILALISAYSHFF